MESDKHWKVYQCGRVEVFDSMWWILQRIYFKAKEDETMAGVTMTQWARIHAKAWLEGKWNGKPGESNWAPVTIKDCLRRIRAQL
jgi:hypothetical protein